MLEITLPGGIPHKGRLYRRVVLSNMTGKVTKEVLASLRQASLAPDMHRRVLRNLLREVIDGPGVTDELLLSIPFGDVQYMLAKVIDDEAKQFDEPATTSRTCRVCNAEVEWTLDLDELEIRSARHDGEDDPEPVSKFRFDPDAGVFKLEAQAIFYKDTSPAAVEHGEREGEEIHRRVTLKLLTLKDMERVRTIISKQNRPSPDRAYFEVIWQSIYEVEGYDPGSFGKEDLEWMARKSLAKLQRIYNDNDIGPVFPTQMSCPGCGNAVPLDLDLVVDFMV